MDKKNIVKEYSNGEVTIVWNPSLCIHSTKCWKGEDSLRQVFNPMEKPWIKPDGAESKRIIDQIQKCPSGALSYYLNETGKVSETEKLTETLIETIVNGPLMVIGNITYKDIEGNLVKRNNKSAFCRCGASSNKPFCDGSHHKIEFKG